MHRTYVIALAALAVACAEPGVTPDADEAPTQAARLDPLAALVLDEWAGDAPIVAVLEIRSTAAVRVAGATPVQTEAVLSIVQVVRDDLDAIHPGDQLLIQVPGGTIGEESWATSEAPLLFQDDEVLARMVRTEDGVAFDGHRSVIPVRGGALAVCANPASDVVADCIANGASLLFTDHAERAPGLAAVQSIPLAHLGSQLD